MRTKNCFRCVFQPGAGKVLRARSVPPRGETLLVFEETLASGLGPVAGVLLRGALLPWGQKWGSAGHRGPREGTLLLSGTHPLSPLILPLHQLLTSTRSTWE